MKQIQGHQVRSVPQKVPQQLSVDS